MAQLILFNKPFGVICQFSASGDRPTLKSYLPQRDISIRQAGSTPIARGW
jgi:16S rRNA U516 pseudouridylate synthase RsuA-like enzyme